MTKFLVDAQLPVRLVRFLQSSSFDAVHTLDLPQGNATRDAEINRLSIQDKRVVVTKDADFAQSILLQGEPYKLLLVSTGNIKNSELERLFVDHLRRLVELLERYSFVELSRHAITVHE